MSSGASKICFNPDCKELKTDRFRKAWALRGGGCAELCDRCASAYEEARFCEAFHSEASGWRNCESCRKRVHCGCIASLHTFIHLDVGGIECMKCAEKELFQVPNQKWPSSTLPPLPLPKSLKKVSAKTCDQSSRSRCTGRWWKVQNSLDSYEVDRPSFVDRMILGEHPTFSQEMAKDPLERKERNVEGLRGTAHLFGENDPTDTRQGVADPLRRSVAKVNFETVSNSCLNLPLHSTVKDDSLLGSPVSFTSPDEKGDRTGNSGATSQQIMPLPPAAKQLFPNPPNGLDSHGDSQAQVFNGRSRAEGQKRGQVLPRYWPRISDQELQQMSGASNSVVTPLFEKMLSASDAGKIGRLVLPKKCAEAYLPAISHPEGLPLKVQDAKGKEWLFQFRFWPNNNSRMYVLEGVTPCIQSMQLQAGDTVTFSRLEPEGKLVMGFRKASSVPSEQDVQAFKAGNGFSRCEVSNRVTKPHELGSAPPLHPFKGTIGTTELLSVKEGSSIGSPLNWPKSVSKEDSGAKLSANKKKSVLGSKNKRLRISREASMDLKLTWEEAQTLLLPPPNYSPSIVVIEGHEFEEYEEAPVLGKPVFSTANHAREKHQWAQCKDCSKWRKLPANVLVPSRWTCSDNIWDPKRSSCSWAQEACTELLEKLPSSNKAFSKVKEEINAVDASEGLDTLANMAILSEGEALDTSSSSSSQATTKHPRHRPGCSCIVCIQPPSGKGPKHEEACTCNVCLTQKRRFHTLMIRREKRLCEKEVESKKEESQLIFKTELEVGAPAYNHGICDAPDAKPLGMYVTCENPDRRESCSPFKGHIDLNIQPEREEEMSPQSISGRMDLPHDPLATNLKDHLLANPATNVDLGMSNMDTTLGSMASPSPSQMQKTI